MSAPLATGRWSSKRHSCADHVDTSVASVAVVPPPPLVAENKAASDGKRLRSRVILPALTLPPHARRTHRLVSTHPRHAAHGTHDTDTYS